MITFLLCIVSLIFICFVCQMGYAAYEAVYDGMAASLKRGTFSKDVAKSIGYFFLYIAIVMLLAWILEYLI